MIVGTAGHIDHGKTAIVRALTGVDTDRLPEEKARGISIALGYAPLELPSGRVLSVVDVPGHERFVPNMLAGVGPVPAARKALERAGIGVDDLDLVELNEAFAAQSVVCIDELGLDPEKVNVNGGAIALGHPLGASGARLVTMLVHELARLGGRYGLATMCIGVGQGIATIVERIEAPASS